MSPLRVTCYICSHLQGPLTANLSPLPPVPTAEWAKPPDRVASGSGSGGMGASLWNSSGGHPQVDKGEASVVPGGWPGERRSVRTRGTCGGGAEGEQPGPPDFGPCGFVRATSLNLGTTWGDKLLILPVEDVKTVAKNRPPLSYHKRKDILKKGSDIVSC